MKGNMKVRGGPSASRVSSQQVVFELKQRVVLALNKLADRDTFQIAVEELEKTIECLTPDGVTPFLSCMLDTDSVQKSTVRRECIRLIGILATFHEDHVSSHLGKIVASIVKRLKDPDSVVRDACVETMGVLASKLGSSEGNSAGVFVALVKPPFETMGEQNKQVQSGSALCLARVIDNTIYPPSSILSRMLIRTVKFLKNPHFMAKSAVIELNRSILQAGGASTPTSLCAAISSIQEALKNSDWNTRKAAAAALGKLASSGGSSYSSLKSSCICSLESCRFDKVKPVRDTVLQALHLWRSVIGSDTPSCSETGSSIKETFTDGGYGDISSPGESTSKAVKLAKSGCNSVVKRSPLPLRKVRQQTKEYSLSSKENDWQIEIAVPKTDHAYLAETFNEESEGSSVTKTFERTSTDISSTQYMGYEFVPVDDKQVFSSMSNAVADNFGTNLVPTSRNSLERGPLVNEIRTSQPFGDEEISTDEQNYFIKMKDRGSLNSTVTMSTSRSMGSCCLQTANEMVTIRKQLSEIANKQSDLLDMLKVFTTNTKENFSIIQLKVSGLECVVDNMSKQLNDGRYHDVSTSKLSKKDSTLASPRLSICTPRPSMDICNRQPLLPKKRNEFFEGKKPSQSKLRSSMGQDSAMWTESRNPVGKGISKGSGQGVNGNQTRNSCSAVTSNAIYYSSESEDSLWMLVKGNLAKGDLNAAYTEALRCGDELLLIELIEKTGPVLENLSPKTTNDLLSRLATYFSERRFINSIIPWLQQVLDLSMLHGPNYLALSAKARREFLYAIQEAVNMDFSSSAERRSVTQLVMKMHQIWG